MEAFGPEATTKRALRAMILQATEGQPITLSTLLSGGEKESLFSSPSRSLVSPSLLFILSDSLYFIVDQSLG
jgi:hypothetical protein